MNILFDIRKEGVEPAGTLLMEIGPDYCNYAIWDQERKSISHLKYISFDEISAEENIEGILNELDLHGISRSVICSAYPQSLLVPHKQFNSDYDLIAQVYDLPDQHYTHDQITEWQMVNLYALPQTIYSLLERLPSKKIYNAFTPALKIYNGFVAEDQICVHFSINSFRVIVKKTQKVQLAQNYFYKSPLDVVYYLLKICYEFGLNQKELYLVLSGLVEADSALYKELHSYFENLHFAHAPLIDLPSDKHPHHFFTSLYNLAACEL